jgi:hypothetical protein
MHQSRCKRNQCVTPGDIMSDFNLGCFVSEHELVTTTLRKQGWYGRGFAFFHDSFPGVCLHIQWKMHN